MALSNMYASEDKQYERLYPHLYVVPVQCVAFASKGCAVHIQLPCYSVQRACLRMEEGLSHWLSSHFVG